MPQTGHFENSTQEVSGKANVQVISTKAQKAEFDYLLQKFHEG